MSLLLHVVLAIVVARIDVVPGGKRDQQHVQERRRSFELRKLPTVDPGVEEQILEALRNSGVVGELSIEQSVTDLAPDPDETMTEPPAASGQDLAAQDQSVIEPGALPNRDEWTPHQQILAIEELAVADEFPGFERKLIPAVERVENAKPVLGGAGELSDEMVASIAAPVTQPTEDPSMPLMVPDMDVPSLAGGGGGGSGTGFGEPDPLFGEVPPDGDGELFQEQPSQISEVRPIEKLLTYRLETYRGFRDFRYGYFRLEIERSGAQVLPHVPKDVILVQDCSASMAEQRLYFCRRGLKQSLPFIGPEDRFNVAYFKESLTTCFDRWAKPTNENIERAEAFIDGMKSGGNTDIYTSLQSLLKLGRKRGRPVIAVVITDGLANKGYTSSSRIISQFSRENQGEISVFTLGTFKLANTYLVDLLSYCNRGDVSVVTSGRWDIPDEIAAIVKDTSRPVLAGLRLNLPAGTACEIYPGQPTNLYLDRPLVLYGRYPKHTKDLVLQVMGEAEKLTCDTIFELAFTDAVKGDDKDIKREWARQKIYHLMGEYARTGAPGALDELRETSRSYDEHIPYRETLGQ
jgi:hypothetical protein